MVTIDTCAGPRAYAGVVFAYRETVTTSFQRLTDRQRTTQIAEIRPPEVRWMTDLVAQ